MLLFGSEPRSEMVVFGDGVIEGDLVRVVIVAMTGYSLAFQLFINH
jgi:hypothetical protein